VIGMNNIWIAGDWSLLIYRIPSKLGRPVSLGRIGFDCCGEYMAFLVLLSCFPAVGRVLVASVARLNGYIAASFLLLLLLFGTL
jgi:hypothetical protein